MANRYGLGLPSLGNLRTPLEGVDLVADEVNRLATLPGTVAGKVLNAAGNAVDNVKRDIEGPREQPERPIPPDQLLAPIPRAIGHIVGGVIDVVKSGVDGVVQNVDGARQELEDFVRG